MTHSTWRRTIVALALAAVFALSPLLSIGAGGLPGLSTPRPEPATSASTSHSFEGSRATDRQTPTVAGWAHPSHLGAHPAAGNIGRIGETYDFLNHSLLPGNFTNISNLLYTGAGVVDQSNGRIYVGGFSGLVGIVDAANSTVVGTLLAFALTAAIEVGPTSSTVYVADMFDTNVTVYNTNTLTVVKSISVGFFPTALLYDPQHRELYVSSGYGYNLTVIDTNSNTVLRSIPTGSAPSSLALDPTHHRLYVANYNSSNVSVVNTTNDQVLPSVAVGANPIALALAAPSGRVYVAAYGANELAVINTSSETVVANVSLAFAPTSVVVDPAVGFVYVAGRYQNAIEVINFRTDAAVGVLPAISQPTALLYDAVTGDVYATEFDTNNLTVINPGSNGILGSIRLGLQPEAVAYDLKTGAIGTAMFDAYSFVLTNGTTGALIATFRVGSMPDAVTYDSVNECFYVANAGSNSVTVINGTTLRVVATIPVTTHPMNIAFVSAFDYLYVLNGAGPFVGTFPTSLTIINGANNQVVGSIAVTADNGIGGLAYNPTNGDLYVGTGTNLTVVGALNHTVVARFPVNLTTSAIAVDSATGTVFVGGLWGPVLFSPNPILTVVNGTSNQIAANLVVGDGVAALDFNAKNGVLYLAQAGFYGNLTAVDPVANVLLGTVGNYLFPAALADTGPGGEVLAAEPYTAALGIVTLPGIGHYAVNFTESGLPSGQSWSVKANGQTLTSTSASIVAIEPDGTVSYTVTTVQGFSAAPNSSTVTVDGSVVAVSIAFTRLPPTFAVNFAETGLPSGSNWSVTLAGVLENSTFPTITFHVSNGSAAYAVGTVGGYVHHPTNGSVFVAGADVLVNVTFTAAATGTTVPGGKAVTGLAEFLGFGFAAVAALLGGAVGAVVGRARRGAPPGPVSSAEPTAEVSPAADDVPPPDVPPE